MKLRNLLKEIAGDFYLIHATSSKYRSSIDKNGLVPKDVKESPHFTSNDKLYFSYDAPGIFATKLRSNLDVYDIKNIKDRVYLVPGVTFDNYEDYKKIAAKKINFYEKMLKAKNIQEKRMLVRDLYEEISNLRRYRGKYDIWLIDNSIANVSWEEDEYGQDGDPERGYDNVGSMVTYQKIPRKAIELIVADGRNLKF